MRRMLLVVLACVVSGCAHQRVAEPAAPEVDPRGVGILDGQSGQAVAWDVLVADAASADAVLIGEMHGHKVGLPVAAALWDDILASDGASGGATPALALEFFDRDTQATIDDYLLDVVDEKEFRELARRSESNYPAGHQAMMESAKLAGARVYAANAPRRYTTLARNEGFERLAGLRSSEQRLFVVPSTLPEGAYRDRFFELFAGMMGGHGGSEDPATEQEQIEGFFRAQSVWDATMASTVSGAMGSARPVVLVVGQFHVDHDGGLLQALRRLRPNARIVTLSMSEGDGSVLAEEDRGRADYVIGVGSADEE